MLDEILNMEIKIERREAKEMKKSDIEKLKKVRLPAPVTVGILTLDKGVSVYALARKAQRLEDDLNFLLSEDPELLTKLINRK